jgi:CDP-diacylglycerol---serine O-phosphatidyltransferase
MSKQPEEPRIYLLPNLMTAGNLCCGFFAILLIVRGIHEGTGGTGNYDFSKALVHYQTAIYLIFGSCIFDLLDGRLARLGGQESPFGQEFDSLADVVSFGVAPALLVSRAVLYGLGFDKLSWFIAFIYLLCGAIRLARFNCLANLPDELRDKANFTGIPIPMAAGFIASITFLIIHLEKSSRVLGYLWNWLLVASMLGLAFLMVSNIKYPSFKKIDMKTKGSISSIVFGSLIIMLLIYEKTRWFIPTVAFSLYLLYGLYRHFFIRQPKSFEENFEN